MTNTGRREDRYRRTRAGVDNTSRPSRSREALSSFTLRAFAAFYLSPAIGALTLFPAPTLAPTLTYMRAGMGLIVPITVAAFVYIGRFDFSDHPVQVAYIAAYLLVAIAVLFVLPWARGRQSPPSSSSSSAVT